ncbi:MAG: PulJ/GspJ family protein, partial [Anaerolineales bacterium]
MKVRADERGFTIPEMLIATVLVASAAGLIATAIYEVFVVARSGNARLAALSDLESASLWIGRDASEAQSFAAGSGTIYGTLTTSNPTIQYRYSYSAANTA